MKQKRRRSRSIAMGGMIVAVGVILLFLTNLFPFVTLSLTAIAGALLLVLVVSINLSAAVRAFIATAMLAGILLPNKEVVLLYVVCFGSYPMIKAKTEQLSRRWLVHLAKGLYCNLAILTVYLATMYLFSLTFLADLFFEFAYGLVLLWVMLNAAFLVYDRVLTLMIASCFKYSASFFEKSSFFRN